MTSLTFPGNVTFAGTVTSPLFISNQQIIAPVAAGTSATLTVGSLSGTIGSITTLTCSSLSSDFGSVTTQFISNLIVNSATVSTGLVVSGKSTNFANQGFYCGWNRVTGTGMTYFANQLGAGTGGFEFLNYNVSGALTNVPLTITAAANVGINTNAPNYRLDVAGSARLGTLTNTSIGTNAGLVVCHSLTSFGLSGAYNSLFDFNFTGPSPGNTANANTGPSPGGRLLIADDNFGAIFRWQSKTQGAMTNSLVERFTVLGSGNVGINNSSPSFNLDITGSCRVIGTASLGPLLTVLSNALGSATNSFINLGGAASTNNSGFISFLSTGGAGASSNFLGLGVWGRDAFNSPLAITGSGFIGINNTNPQFTLDVNGSARVTGGEIIGSISQATFGPGNYGQVRMVGGTVGSMWRNDGSSLLLLFTNPNDAYGQWNSLRPLCVNVSTGFLGLNNTAPSFTLDVNGSARITGTTTLSKRIGWTNIPGATVLNGVQAGQYCIDELGYLRLRGVIGYQTNSNTSTVQATLPSTACPNVQTLISGLSNNQVPGIIYINPNNLSVAGGIYFNTTSYSGSGFLVDNITIPITAT